MTDQPTEQDKLGVSNVPHAPVVSTRVARDSEWQPIETAPDDIWLITCRAGERRANITRCCTAERHGTVEWVDQEGRTTITHSTFAPPTHWMPLPPPPSDGASVGPAPSSTVTQNPEVESLKVDIARTLEIASREATRADALAKENERLKVLGRAVAGFFLVYDDEEPLDGNDAHLVALCIDEMKSALIGVRAALSETAAKGDPCGPGTK